MSSLLQENEIAEKLASVPGWSRRDNEIQREFRFPDFVGSLRFVNEVGALAEEAGHHPDIDIRWNKVLLRLSTHSKGGLTEADFALAAKINALAG